MSDRNRPHSPPSTRASDAAASSRGLTLIELLVVLALIGLVATLAAPALSEMIAVQRVRGIHAELVTDLQYARSEAARRSARVAIAFGSNARMTCYSIYAMRIATETPCDCTAGGATTCSTEIKRRQIERSTNVTLTASSPLLTFNAVAAMENPPSIDVDVVSSVRGRLRTTVNPTGRPSVCTPDGSMSQVPACTP